MNDDDGQKKKGEVVGSRRKKKLYFQKKHRCYYNCFIPIQQLYVHSINYTSKQSKYSF